MKVNIKTDFRVIDHVQIELNRLRISGKFSFSDVSYVAQLSSSCFLYKCSLNQCFSSFGPRTCAGPWHQLYRAAKRSPGICHFSFLSNFHE